jgi:transcriptional regulator with XRE-family HTH domain
MRNLAYITPEMLTWARRESRLTRAAIAARVRGATPERLALWEKGKCRPTFWQAQRLAEAMGIPFGYFFLSAHNIPKLDGELNREALRRRKSKSKS